MEWTHETFDTTIEVGIGTIIDQLKRRVNLPSDVEEIVEKALHLSAKYGTEKAKELVLALRQRVGGDTL